METTEVLDRQARSGVERAPTYQAFDNASSRIESALRREHLLIVGAADDKATIQGDPVMSILPTGRRALGVVAGVLLAVLPAAAQKTSAVYVSGL